MATTVPDAVVMDYSKEHHYVVLVRKGEGLLSIMCLDCQDELTIEMDKLTKFENILAGGDDMQVVAWIEDNG